MELEVQPSTSIDRQLILALEKQTTNVMVYLKIPMELETSI